MKCLKDRLLDYLETLSGVRPDLSPTRAETLPLFLRERYDLFTTPIFGRSYLLALETPGWKTTSPGDYAKHIENIQHSFSSPVVLVLPLLPSYTRNGMVQMGIPFIVPGSQSFLPNSVIDLREHFPLPSPKRRETFSPAAQCAVLYHLLRGSLAATPLKEIAGKIHYSPMMMTNVKNELEAAGICEIIQSGRSMALNFSTAGQSLWEKVKHQLSSPVKKTRWVQWEWRDRERPALLGGITALSMRTMIADDRLPTYALSPADFASFLEYGVTCRDAENATAKIETWSYNPRLLTGDEMVDPLSLYLSLRNSPDERVQQQLEQLIAKVQW
jgi:DNA-binding MarR family transcriptional regulator